MRANLAAKRLADINSMNSRLLQQALSIAVSVASVWVLKDWLTSNAAESDFPYRSLSLLSTALMGPAVSRRLFPQGETWLLAAFGLMIVLSCFATGDGAVGLGALATLFMVGFSYQNRTQTVVGAAGALLLGILQVAKQEPWPLWTVVAFSLSACVGCNTREQTQIRLVAGWASFILLLLATCRLCLSLFQSRSPGWLGVGLSDIDATSAGMAQAYGWPLVAAGSALFAIVGAYILLTLRRPLEFNEAVGTSLLTAVAVSILHGTGPFGPSTILLTAALSIGARALLPKVDRSLKPKRAWIWSAVGVVVAIAAGGWFLIKGVQKARADLLLRLNGHIASSSIPAALEQATIAMEDGHFRNHRGFDFPSLHRSLRRDIRSLAYVEGGSTITQQAARYAFAGKDKTMLRKVREACMTVAMESTLSKNQILSIYLNSADYGFGCIGVDRASEFYFSTTRDRLSLPQVLFLVSCVPKPPRAVPALKAALRRRQVVATRMAFWFPDTWPAPLLEEAATIPPNQLFSKPFLSHQTLSSHPQPTRNHNNPPQPNLGLRP